MTFSGKSVFRRNRQERGKENDGAMSGAETTTSSEKNKRVILNIITAIGYQVVIAVFGLVLPRLYLVNFGSEVNGLNSTIKNILHICPFWRRGLDSRHSIPCMDL